MDDSKLLQESNLTAGLPTGHHIMLYIPFNKRCHLASVGLINLTGIIPGSNSGLPALCAKVLPLLPRQFFCGQELLQLPAGEYLPVDIPLCAHFSDSFLTLF